MRISFDRRLSNGGRISRSLEGAVEKAEPCLGSASTGMARAVQMATTLALVPLLLKSTGTRTLRHMDYGQFTDGCDFVSRSRRWFVRRECNSGLHGKKLAKAGLRRIVSHATAALLSIALLSVRATRYLRERWLTPDGRTIVAALPEGTRGHFGPDLRRFMLMQYHQGQTTLPRLTALLQSVGVSISKRAVQRLLTEQQQDFLDEARDVLRAGLEISPWVSVDDTGARHKARNGFCTQIGNDWFTWFATRSCKTRLNFLDLLRAGHTDYVVNQAAFDYMRGRGLAGPLIARLAEAGETHFTDPAAWQRHLNRLGIVSPAKTGLAVIQDPVLIATEGAQWGSIQAHGFLRDAVVLSDDAGQFDIGQHALCWVHAERLVHKLDTFTDLHRAAQQRMRTLIWNFYAALKSYRTNPAKNRRLALRARFDRIFRRRTGFVTLDRLLKRLHANKSELLMVLDRPEIPLHTNGSENDIRCQVTRRKVSAGTRSDGGRDCRDGFLGLAKTCAKHGIAFWDYLGSRLGIQGQPAVPPLANMIRCWGTRPDLRLCPYFCPFYAPEKLVNPLILL